MKKTVSITLDEKLLSEIDNIRGYVPRSIFIGNVLLWSINFQTANQFLKKNKRGDGNLTP